MAAELEIPDPRKQPVQTGWSETVAAPAILTTDKWEDLDEYEARLKAFGSYILAFDGDHLEFEKALRIVDNRRGELLGSRVISDDASEGTQKRWRRIHKNWETVWPLIVEAKQLSQVTQAAVLRKCVEVERKIDGEPLPAGVFSTIVADPPWRYENTATRAAAADHYATMSVEELCDLPVKEWAADEAHLYLWTTNGFLRQAFDVLEAWGFQYKTTLVWVKPQMGIGNYFRSSTEYVLFGVRGGLHVKDSNQMNWFEAKRARHSAKPGFFFDLVERVSPGPYLEMFARSRRLTEASWDYWGHEA